MIPFRRNRLGIDRPKYFIDAVSQPPVSTNYGLSVETSNGNHIKFNSAKIYDQWGYINYTHPELQMPYSVSWYSGGLPWFGTPVVNARPEPTLITMRLVNVKGTYSQSGLSPQDGVLIVPYRPAGDIIPLSLTQYNNFDATYLLPANVPISYIGGIITQGTFFDNFEGDLEIYINGKLLMEREG